MHVMREKSIGFCKPIRRAFADLQRRAGQCRHRTEGLSLRRVAVENCFVRQPAGRSNCEFIFAHPAKEGI